MSLGQDEPPVGDARFPRPRGDEPAGTGDAYPGNIVFPARAGMSPSRPYPNQEYACFPRPRGDEPVVQLLAQPNAPFSPPARG